MAYISLDNWVQSLGNPKGWQNNTSFSDPANNQAVIKAYLAANPNALQGYAAQRGLDQPIVWGQGNWEGSDTPQIKYNTTTNTWQKDTNWETDNREAEGDPGQNWTDISNQDPLAIANGFSDFFPSINIASQWSGKQSFLDSLIEGATNAGVSAMVGGAFGAVSGGFGGSSIGQTVTGAEQTVMQSLVDAGIPSNIVTSLPNSALQAVIGAIKNPNNPLTGALTGGISGELSSTLASYGVDPTVAKTITQATGQIVSTGSINPESLAVGAAGNLANSSMQQNGVSAPISNALTSAGTQLANTGSINPINVASAALGSVPTTLGQVIDQTNQTGTTQTTPSSTLNSDMSSTQVNNDYGSTSDYNTSVDNTTPVNNDYGSVAPPVQSTDTAVSTPVTSQDQLVPTQLSDVIDQQGQTPQPTIAGTTAGGTQMGEDLTSLLDSVSNTIPQDTSQYFSGDTGGTDTANTLAGDMSSTPVNNDFGSVASDTGTPGTGGSGYMDPGSTAAGFDINNPSTWGGGVQPDASLGNQVTPGFDINNSSTWGGGTQVGAAGSDAAGLTGAGAAAAGAGSDPLGWLNKALGLTANPLTLGNIAKAGTNYALQKQLTDQLTAAAQQSLTAGSALNQPQRQQYQNQLSTLMSNPSSFFQTNPVVQGQLNQANQQFQANTGKMGTSGTNFNDYLTNMQNIMGKSFNDQANILSGLGGFNQGATNGTSAFGSLSNTAAQATNAGNQGLGQLLFQQQGPVQGQTGTNPTPGGAAIA